ncbi:lebercilin-like protein isoform X2 [Engystomops pustulosus]|uniref:lebercilin-like protein isoform X2 n=1 Tax=Engystomops pustulosus TaxID=76066 RepID=UPI003AFB7AB0
MADWNSYPVDCTRMSSEGSGEDREEWSKEPSIDSEQRSFSCSNDPTPSRSSDRSSTDQSPRSKTSCSNPSLSDNSSPETPQSVNEAQNSPEKTPEQKNMHQRSPKVDKGFSWRKSPPWKRLSLKIQHPPFTVPKAERDVSQRIFLAQVRKIKELKDELCDVQRNLEAVNRENRLLTRLQHRHMKALQKYESSDSGLQQLLTRHSNEVRTLRENLRATQESERGLSLKLKMADSELLKARDSLQRLQRLAEDKHLAERDDLNNKLSSLLIKMEIDSAKVKVLEKQLHLTARFYDRQLALESRKASEARDTTRRLQDEILSLQHIIKEKERELHIKNIYAHRMPRNRWKFGGLECQEGLTFSKSTQTEHKTCPQDLPGEGVGDYDPQDKNNESENDSAREEDNNPQMSREDAPKHEVNNEKDDDFLATDGMYTEQDKESSTEEPNQIILEEHLCLEDTMLHEKNPLDDSWNESKCDPGRRIESNDARSFLPRLSRRYTFTIATENLHQGLPASGPISGLSKSNSCKSLYRDYSLGHGDLSLPKIEGGNCNERKERRPEVSLIDRKKNLMEELFGPGYEGKNSFSNDFVNSEKEFSL